MILKKIKYHFDNKKYVRTTRRTGKDFTAISHGYIVGYSDEFLILQETDDFRVLGYNILPVRQIKKNRFNKNDQYYHKIMIWEGEIEKVGINYKIELGGWRSIFNNLKDMPLNIIVECEDPNIQIFTIGTILKTTQKRVYIQHFYADGFWDEEPVKIELEDITKVIFDDRYINVFSKYLRYRKAKK